MLLIYRPSITCFQLHGMPWWGWESLTSVDLGQGHPRTNDVWSIMVGPSKSIEGIWVSGQDEIEGCRLGHQDYPVKWTSRKPPRIWPSPAKSPAVCIEKRVRKGWTNKPAAYLKPMAWQSLSSLASLATQPIPTSSTTTIESHRQEACDDLQPLWLQSSSTPPKRVLHGSATDDLQPAWGSLQQLCFADFHHGSMWLLSVYAKRQAMTSYERIWLPHTWDWVLPFVCLEAVSFQ